MLSVDEPPTAAEAAGKARASAGRWAAAGHADGSLLNSLITVDVGGSDGERRRSCCRRSYINETMSFAAIDRASLQSSRSAVQDHLTASGTRRWHKEGAGDTAGDRQVHCLVNQNAPRNVLTNTCF